MSVENSSRFFCEKGKRGIGGCKVKEVFIFSWEK